MLTVLKNCCSKTYLDMMKHAAMTSTHWNMKYPIGLDDKHLKLDIIENEPLEPILAGMAMGLLIQIMIWVERTSLFQKYRIALLV